jgi:putative heme-binding domain-containing protein
VTGIVDSIHILWCLISLSSTGGQSAFPARGGGQLTELESTHREIADDPVARHKLDELRRAAMNRSGDAANGKRLFASESLKCLACHKVHVNGGDAGPDLSQVAGKFDRTHLIESVLDPSAQILEGYHTTIVRLTDGRVLQGIVTDESAAGFILIDATNKKTTIALSEVTERKVSDVSLMPADLAASLTLEEFTDLIDYLETLRTGRKLTPGEGIAGAVTLPDGFAVEPIAVGLTGATAMEVTPDGRVFVCEQTGSLRVVKDGRLLEEPLLRVPVTSTWERGLIGVTVAPDFPRTPHVFVCYVAGKPYPHHIISRWTARGDRAEPGSEVVSFEGDDQTKLGGFKPDGHQGGAIHFGGDGKLYVAIGEQTAASPSQDMGSLLGKMLRLNVDGSIPPDNPFFTTATGKYRSIWALGLRNPFTFAVQPKTGRIFINDVGGRAEEINDGIAGSNYGWPTVEHGPTSDPRFRGPIHHYPTACIAGGAFTPSNLQWPSEYRGRYFFADFNHGVIRTIDPDSPDESRPFATGLTRPVDLRFAPDGSLLVLLRNAWVIDDHFSSNTGSLAAIRWSEKHLR